MSITVTELLAEGRALLVGDEARIEVELLLVHVLGRDRAWLRAHDRDPVTAVDAERYRCWLRQRASGTPIAYLLGEREFWSLPLAVSPAVLIPRADTECLVEQALARIPTDQPCRIADLGTGSGAIALAVAHERAAANVLATDVSADALAIASANARRLGLAQRVRFRQGVWYTALTGEPPFDLLLSNPPYIADQDPHLLRGDLRHEPAGALASGPDGLDAIGVLVAGAPTHLVPGGWLLLEHGHDQGAAVRALLDAAGFDRIGTERDLGGNERVSFGATSRRLGTAG